MTNAKHSSLSVTPGSPTPAPGLAPGRLGSTGITRATSEDASAGKGSGNAGSKGFGGSGGSGGSANTISGGAGLDAAGDLVACLAHLIRFEILCLLGRSPLNVTELTEALELDMSSVSLHLRHLRDGGFVTMSIDGHHHVYRLHERLVVTETDSNFHMKLTDHNGIDLELMVSCEGLYIARRRQHGS